MEYKVLTDDDLTFFKKTVGVGNVLTSDLEKYASDKAEDLQFYPDVVLKPTTAEQISELVKYCNENLLPITPRGAGTGRAGGALPIKGGVVIAIERMDEILEIDENNFQVKLEPGVINYNLQKALEEKNLFFPPDPASWQSSFIGGNIATNAGGPRAVKYGVTAQYVLNLEVVLPNGEIIWTGADTLKNSTGYSLTQLFVGSEGTLGIITKAVLKVLPKPEKDISLLVPFHQMEEACEAVSALFYAGIHPSTLEFMEERAIDATSSALFPNGGSPIANVSDEAVEAHLLISLDENIEVELKKCVDILMKYDIGEILFADNDTEKERIWQIRRKVSEVLIGMGYTIEEDTVVPRAKLAELVKQTRSFADKYNMKSACYGHAGDGNLHVRFNHPQFKKSFEVPEMEEILTEFFQIVKDLDGTVSAEHGIGLIQKKYLPIVFSEANMELQKTIKKAIDPRIIMNPGKAI